MTLRSPSDKSRAQEILDNKAVYISDLATFSLVMSAHGCAVPYRGPYAHDRGLSGPPVHGDDHARTGHRHGCGRDCVRKSARAHADGGAGGLLLTVMLMGMLMIMLVLMGMLVGVLMFSCSHTCSPRNRWPPFCLCQLPANTRRAAWRTIPSPKCIRHALSYIYIARMESVNDRK